MIFPNGFPFGVFKEIYSILFVKEDKFRALFCGLSNIDVTFSSSLVLQERAANKKNAKRILLEMGFL
jgi:hypothetical protein